MILLVFLIEQIIPILWDFQMLQTVIVPFAMLQSIWMKVLQLPKQLHANLCLQLAVVVEIERVRRLEIPPHLPMSFFTRP